jgi:hypothetical protein
MTIQPRASRPLLRAALLGALLGAAFAASASVDDSPKPGGVYKLKPGIYVAQDSPCESPANAAIRQYDGRGIGSAHTRACTVHVRARKGQRYTVDQSCIDAGAGPAPRRVQRQQVWIQDALTFTQTIGGHATTYRYCPVYQLPPDLRKAVPR